MIWMEKKKKEKALWLVQTITNNPGFFLKKKLRSRLIFDYNIQLFAGSFMIKGA